MTVILALDAAWTPTEPTGVALVKSKASGWSCAALAPSYDNFLTWQPGPGWHSEKLAGSIPDPKALLAAAQRIAGAPVDLVVIDMPIAKVPIAGRRSADDAISRTFGGRKCSAHSPNTTRPGALGAQLTEQFAKAGFPVKAAGDLGCPGLIEAYPHVALLSLLEASNRVPYKVSKAARYWPGAAIPDRISKLLLKFKEIQQRLHSNFADIDLTLPKPEGLKLSHLKPYEAMLDALICAWIGTLYVEGKARAYGDQSAAVWCPADLG